MHRTRLKCKDQDAIKVLAALIWTLPSFRVDWLHSIAFSTKEDVTIRDGKRSVLSVSAASHCHCMYRLPALRCIKRGGMPMGALGRRMYGTFDVPGQLYYSEADALSLQWDSGPGSRRIDAWYYNRMYILTSPLL